MTPLISVPEDDLKLEYIPLPTRQYDATLVSLSPLQGEPGPTIESSWADFATTAGEPTITTTFKGREVTIDLSTRTKRWRMFGRDIAKLASELGFAVKEDGHVEVPGETPEEIVANFDPYIGQRLRLSIRQEPRKRAKVVQTNEKGEPIIDDNIRNAWRVAESGR